MYGAIAGALIGGLAGSQKDVVDNTQSTSVDLRDMNELNQGEGEQAGIGRGIQKDQLNALRELLTQGGAQQASGDIEAARGEQMSLIDMLRQAQGQAPTGPNAQQVSSAQDFSSAIFAPQEEAMRQQFQQSETDTSRLAARLGRQVDDPILRAKLAQNQANAMGTLGAQKGALTAQTAQQNFDRGQQFQQQRLGMQEQIAGIRGGLATQALQNRQALMGMGQSLLNQERQFRLGAAGQTTNQQQTSGGGIADILGGALGGAGAMAKFGGA